MARSRAGRDTKLGSVLGTADNSNSTRIMETDDYRRQGFGTSSRGTSVADGRGTELCRIAAVDFAVRKMVHPSSNGKYITAAWRPC